MSKIVDVGKKIPLAKKDRFGSNIGTPGKAPSSKRKAGISLKKLWLEPDWQDLYSKGLSREAVACLYCVYHSLRKRPYNTDSYFGNTLVTTEMWAEAYQQTVEFIRDRCMNAVSPGCFTKIEEKFNEAFSKGDQGYSYITYAAGTKTSRSYFHPLGTQGINGAAGHLKRLLPILGFPVGIDPKKLNLFPVQFTNRNSKERFYMLCNVTKKSYSWTERGAYENRFNNYDDAVAALIKHHSKEFAITNEPSSTTDKKPKKSTIYKPQKNLTGIQGVSSDFESVDAESLLNEFAFRGIQFGNYVTQGERQAYLDNAYHSFGILAKLLGVPKKGIGKGVLGLAIGARGSGGSAAHFERDLFVINLTRLNGAGCIAHEYFHYIDAYLAARLGYRGSLLSELGMPGTSENQPSCVSKNTQVFLRLKNECMKSTSFVRNAIRLGGQSKGSRYWDKPSEIMARAFEAYMQDKLALLRIKESWLAFGTKPTDYVKNGMHPYPCGKDRVKVFRAFECGAKYLYGESN